MIHNAVATWATSQKLKSPAMTHCSPFYRNLEESLDSKRKDLGLLVVKSCPWKTGDAVDFTSNDTLSLGSSGMLREEFDQEMARNPNLMLGSTSSRLVDGNSEYLELVEREIADFHGAEEGLFVASGFEANAAVFAALIRPGDVLVYDALVHASMYDGMQQSAAATRRSFRHNDVDALRDVLCEIHDGYEKVRRGQCCVIIAVESVYSMDGDICPLEDLVEAAKEIFPSHNVEFVVDEAHSTGVFGRQGRGLVCQLGLEKSIAVRVHTFGKAVSAAGAILLGNLTVKTALTNFARSIIYTTAPASPVVATVRAAYNLMRSGRTEHAQIRIQQLATYFFTSIEENTTFNSATSRGILTIPLLEDWSERSLHTHIIPIRTRNQYSLYLASHLIFSGFTAFFADYPTVPKGQSRVRLALHDCNTEVQIDGLIEAICDWAEEMIQIEDGKVEGRVPSAAKKVLCMVDGELGR